MSFINDFYELNSVCFDLHYIRNLIRTPCVISSPFAASRFQKVQEVLRQEWWPCLEGADDRMEVYSDCWALMTFEECLIKWEISIFKQVVAWTISGKNLKMAHSDGTDVLTAASHCPLPLNSRHVARSACRAWRHRLDPLVVWPHCNYNSVEVQLIDEVLAWSCRTT